MWDLSPTSPADEGPADEGHPDGYLEWWLRRVADGDPPQEPSESSSTEDRAVILAEQAENDALLESIAAAEAQAEDAVKQAALRERLEAEAARRAKRAEARAMEAARREAAAQAAARDEAERQAAMEREIQRRVEECVTQRVQEAQHEVLQVPNVFVLLGRLEQAEDAGAGAEAVGFACHDDDAAPEPARRTTGAAQGPGDHFGHHWSADWQIHACFQYPEETASAGTVWHVRRLHPRLPTWRTTPKLRALGLCPGHSGNFSSVNPSAQKGAGWKVYWRGREGAVAAAGKGHGQIHPCGAGGEGKAQEAKPLANQGAGTGR